MRFRPASRAVVLAVSLVAPWASGQSSGRADILVGSTVIPTSSVLTTSYLPSMYLPTSYVLPTSTYLPTTSILETGSSVYLPTTSYVSTYRTARYRPRRFVERTSYYGYPTSYLSPTTYYSPTSFVAPTSYLSSALLPTSYVVPTMSTSSIFPTTYLSSSFVSPTSYLVDDGLIATSASSAVCCDTGSTTSMAPSVATPTRSMNTRPPTSSNAGNAIMSQPSGGGTNVRSTERAPSSTVNPTPGDQGMPSDVGPGVANTPIPAAPGRTGGEVVSPPPAQPAPEKSGDLPAPGSMGGGLPPQTDDRIDRTSLRPNYKVRNILRGRVVTESGSPEEAVTVVLSNRAGGFSDRTTQTDAFGEFKISLPDGDWAVKVTMPSGSVYNVGPGVTAGGGQVIDSSSNRIVTDLRITR